MCNSLSHVTVCLQCSSAAGSSKYGFGELLHIASGGMELMPAPGM